MTKAESAASRTPRSDAAAVVCYGEGGIERSFGFRAVPLEDARTLELEAADLRSCIKDLRERLAKAEADADRWQKGCKIGFPRVRAPEHTGCSLTYWTNGTGMKYASAELAIDALAHPKGEDHGGENAKQHQWSEDGERCLKCGDKDWMGGPCNG